MGPKTPNEMSKKMSIKPTKGNEKMDQNQMRYFLTERFSDSIKGWIFV
jgi:hypothetical protein